MVSWQVGVTLGQLVHNWRKVDCTIMAELSGLCFQIRMAKSPETVSKFLTGLAEKVPEPEVPALKARWLARQWVPRVRRLWAAAIRGRMR